MKENSFSPHNDYAGIHLFNESPVELPLTLQTIQAIAAAIRQEENCAFQLIEIVFVDEAEIVRINREHLERDYVTDIISFRYDEAPDNRAIEGTLYCCAPRIIEQAAEFDADPSQEFQRIVIHGLLHLAGYEDQSPEDKKQMQQKEDFFLSKI